MSVGIESGFSNDEVLCARFPLHRACRDGDVRALCSLLQLHGGQAEIHTEDSLYGWTPIHWAAHFGKYRLLELTRRFPTLAVNSENVRTARYNPVYNLECVLRLVEVGCEVNSVTTRFGQTPAHIAAFGGHPECLLWLLQAGADINRQDYVGEAPIHKAARAGSMECVNALLISGATPELRNTNGLTAADLARAQGFHECAQLLFNAANQLRQLNGFGRNGTELTCIQGRSLLSGVTNRKRLHECSEFNRVKKARVDGVDFPVKTINGTELESMHVESTSASQSDGTIETATGLSSGYMQKSYTPNGHCQPLQPLAESDGDMCGSLHLSGSPGSCTSQRPVWATFPSDVGNHLHYGYYHGFGDTAEDLEDAASHHEHCKTVKLEQHYHQELVHAMQLFHGS